MNSQKTHNTSVISCDELVFKAGYWLSPNSYKGSPQPSYLFSSLYLWKRGANTLTRLYFRLLLVETKFYLASKKSN